MGRLTLLGAGKAPTVGGGTWQVNVTNATIDSQETGYFGFTIVARIEAAQLANTGSGTQVRVTLASGTTGEGMKIAASYIAHAAASGSLYDFETTPTQLLFSGIGSVTIPVNSLQVSDAVAFTVQSSKAIIIASYFDDTGNDSIGGHAAVVTGWSYYWRNANDPATVDKNGYTLGTGLGGAMIFKIESLI